MSVTGLGKITLTEIKFIELVIEGFLYGLYSAIFWMYIQYHASKELGIHKRNILFYAVCILYTLSTATLVIDITGIVTVLTSLSLSKADFFRMQALSYTSNTVNALCEFISQGILIYRCWVIWGRNICLIIIPSILSLVFLAIWLATNGSLVIVPRAIQKLRWGEILGLTALGISLTVNAAVTGLILLRILKVYKEVKLTFEHRNLGNGGPVEARLRPILLIIIESSMAMFTIQLIRFVLNILEINATFICNGINQMFNGITPTIILLRVSMGLSYHDEQSMMDTAASWRFMPYNQNPGSENGGIENVGQERLDPIGIQQQSDDIEIVDR